GFEDENIGGADPFDDQLGGMAKIGQKTDACAIGPEHKTDRIIGIVRDGKGVDGQIAYLKGTAGAENAKIEAGFELELDRFLGEAIAIDRNGNLAAKSAETVGMIGMFVGEKDAAEGFRGTADLSEAFADLAGAKASIDQ